MSTFLTRSRLHVHQMVMRALEICFLGRKRRRLANPLSTLFLAPFVMAPPIAGVMLWDQTNMAFMAVMVFAALFFSSYAIGPHLIRRFRRCACPIDLIGKPIVLMTVTDDASLTLTTPSQKLGSGPINPHSPSNSLISLS